MKNFRRPDPLFSLCGLNCGLCTMYIGGYCPGCGGGEGNQACAIARCSLNHGGVAYCIDCEAYPCEKYQGIELVDSFILHRNQRKDLEKMKTIGLDAYQKELHEKMELLSRLLSDYNDGRRKSFYCLSVNLLEMNDLEDVMKQIEEKTGEMELSGKEKAKTAVEAFERKARSRGILLRLNRKKQTQAEI
ncbi:DUF3795 domain-containing protein [Proteiniclasticum sp. C24MP]|uniref:DUF3795 domain-containing protein n=1 Tax=Proteiniclasticum sp. C24MP TaxID=3374101 RepID=UPI003754C144